MLKRLQSKASHLLPKSAFLRGVGVLVGGTASAQLLMLLAAPLLTRLYSPETFGLLAVFTAILALFAVVASGRYELAIPLPESDKDAANLVFVGLLCVLLTAIVAFVTVLLWSGPIANLVNAPELAPYLWLVPLGVLFIGGYQVFNKWAVRTKRFTHIARTRVWQALGTLGIQITGFKLGAVALLGGQAAGQGVGLISLTSSALSHEAFKQSSTSEGWLLAKRYKDFPIYSTWTGLFNVASLQLAPVLFMVLFGASVAGLYALTHRILSMPASLIGNAVGSIFLSEAPNAHRKGELPLLVERLHKQLSVVGLLPLILVVLFGEQLFSIVFGEQWREAGVYAQWMAPWLYAHFKWSPLSTISVVLELQSELLVADFFLLSGRLIAVFILWKFGFSSFPVIVGFSIVSALLYLVRLAWFMRKAGASVSMSISMDLCFFLACFLILLV